MTQKLSEQSGAKQLASVLGIVAVFVSLFGAGFLALADQTIDRKYATDDDLKAVQETTEAGIERIETAVNTNTKAVRVTSSSVDGLTLVVMDLQIDKLEGQIRADEREKRAEAAAWNERDEDGLRGKQKALADLSTQRELLFARLIANQPGA